jgi:hypothetical protein
MQNIFSLIPVIAHSRSLFGLREATRKGFNSQIPIVIDCQKRFYHRLKHRRLAAFNLRLFPTPTDRKNAADLLAPRRFA